MSVNRALEGRRLLQVILAEESGEDPFRFPLAQFRALSDDKRADLMRRADRIVRDRIDAELACRRAAWLVLVGGDVVLASADPEAIPSTEDVLRLGEPRGLVAYLFEAPLIEEVPSPVSPWTTLSVLDRYPTIQLTIEGMSIVADLDTARTARWSTPILLRCRVARGSPAGISVARTCGRRRGLMWR